MWVSKFECESVEVREVCFTSVWVVTTETPRREGRVLHNYTVGSRLQRIWFLQFAGSEVENGFTRRIAPTTRHRLSLVCRLAKAVGAPHCILQACPSLAILHCEVVASRPVSSTHIPSLCVETSDRRRRVFGTVRRKDLSITALFSQTRLC